jgi:hypothetical protein
MSLEKVSSEQEGKLASRKSHLALVETFVEAGSYAYQVFVGHCRSSQLLSAELMVSEMFSNDGTLWLW